jgi:hypothetical protein
MPKTTQKNKLSADVVEKNTIESELVDENRTKVSRGIEGGLRSIFEEEDHSKGIGVIRNVSIMRKGFVKDSRGWEIDDTTLEQLASVGNSLKAGQKSRFGHPNMSSTALGTFLGRFKDFRVDGNFVRADIYFDKTAYETPSGDLATYVINLAKSDPGSFGVSIAMREKELEWRVNKDGKYQRDSKGKILPPLLRIKKLSAVDIVDDPAASDEMFDKNFFTDSVKLSAEATAVLDKVLQSQNAVETIANFLNRYRKNKQMDLAEDTDPEPENQTSEEEPKMDELRIENITLDQLKVGNPKLYSEIIETGKKEGEALGMVEGQKVERERCQSIVKQSEQFKDVDGINELAAEAINDGLSSEKALISFQNKQLELLKKETPTPVQPNKEDNLEQEIEDEEGADELSVEARCTKEWEKNAKLQKEFGKLSTYIAFQKNLEKGNVRIKTS